MDGRVWVDRFSSIEFLSLGRSLLVNFDVDLEQMVNGVFDELLFASVPVETD